MMSDRTVPSAPIGDQAVQKKEPLSSGAPENVMPVQKQDIAELISLIRGESADDHSELSAPDAPGRYYGNHKFLAIKVERIEQRTPALTRIWFRPEPSSFDGQWHTPNIAMRLEIPVTPEEYVGVEGAPPTASRAYTVAEYDNTSGTIAIDFVVHGTTSPVMQWMQSVKSGDVIYSWEPGQHRVPQNAGRVLFAADSTALPAALSIIRDRSTFESAVLFAAASDEELVLAKDLLADIEVHVVGVEPGELAAAVTCFSGECDWLWACGESGEMRPIRKFGRETLGLDRARVQVFGYWKRNQSHTLSDLSRLQRMRQAMINGEDLEAVEAQLEEEL